MKILASGLLVLSLALNLFLWNRLSKQGNQLKSAQASASEADELRRQNQELQVKRTSTPDSTGVDARDLARLRNEVGPLRQQAAEAATLRAQAAEAAQLRARLATATQDLARTESQLADAVKMSPEEMQQLKGEAQSIQCVNNLKQILLAARMWFGEHNNVYPPDFLAMKNELPTPTVLFCPADAAALRVTEWSQLNPSSISYRFLNPNGNDSNPTNLVTICPIHGHTGLVDGSVHRDALANGAPRGPGR